MDILIIGGGAAGFMCAVTAAAGGAGVAVLERNDRPLKKLLATGNGRCNYTNVNCAPADYFGEEPGFAKAALSVFGAADTVAFFRRLGVEPYEGERGRLYPRSLQAASMVDALRLEAERLGVNIQTGAAVTRLEKRGGMFHAHTQNGAAQARAAVLACGGAAGGGGREGYALARTLGHGVTELTPALAQLTAPAFSRGLQGVKVEAAVTAVYRGKPVATENGELLFTERGLSGNAIFALSAYWPQYPGFDVSVDFAPEYDETALYKLFYERAKNLAHLPLEHFLNGFIHKKVGMALCKRAVGEKLTMPCAGLAEAHLRRLAAIVKDTRVAITEPAGFRDAQVTAGGLRTDAFDAATLASRLVPGLHAIGELLDVTGPCGGYNLQWAWSSGRAAGLALGGMGAGA